MKSLTKVLTFAVFSLVISPNLYGQICFDAYEQLFTDENKTLSYKDFHKLELEFLDNLEGCEAVYFNVQTIEGAEINLAALKGKIVVLNFWFTTCMPCLKEIPELNKLVEAYDSDEVVFIGFARDNKEKLDVFFRKFMHFNYQIVAESHQIADEYKVVGWPQSMVIDKRGKVFKAWAGLNGDASILKKEIAETIDACLLY